MMNEVLKSLLMTRAVRALFLPTLCSCALIHLVSSSSKFTVFLFVAAFDACSYV